MFTREYTSLPLTNQYLTDLAERDVDVVVEAIGRERLTAYADFTANDREALALYQVNSQLSKHIHEAIGGFEVALRNEVSQSIAAHYERPDWYRCLKFKMKLAKPRRDNIRDVRRRLQADRRDERSGRVIAGLTFHFWVSMHENKYRDVVWTPHLHKLWPKGENLKHVHKDLLKTRDLRNRIAHHEPIFLPRWHERTAGMWARFEQVSPVMCAWYRQRLEPKIGLLSNVCNEQISQ